MDSPSVGTAPEGAAPALEPIGYMETHRCKLSLLGEPQMQVGRLAWSGLCFRTTMESEGLGPCFSPASARRRRSYLLSRDSPRRERKFEAKLFKNEAGREACC